MNLEIYKVKNNVPNIDQAIISVHCHNDLGLAVANSLNAVENGARQIECTIMVLVKEQECCLEEVVMAMKVRSDLLNVIQILILKLYLKLQNFFIYYWFPVQPNKAIVGLMLLLMSLVFTRMEY